MTRQVTISIPRFTVDATEGEAIARAISDLPQGGIVDLKARQMMDLREHVGAKHGHDTKWLGGPFMTPVGVLALHGYRGEYDGRYLFEHYETNGQHDPWPPA